MAWQALLIEDDEDLAEIFTLALERVGFAVTWLADGPAAEARLGGPAPAVVVLDLHVPQFNATHFIKTLRANPVWGQTRLVIASSDDRHADALRPLVNRVLLKPISPEQMAQLVLRLVPKDIG